MNPKGKKVRKTVSIDPDLLEAIEPYVNIPRGFESLSRAVEEALWLLLDNLKREGAGVESD